MCGQPNIIMRLLTLVLSASDEVIANGEFLFVGTIWTIPSWRFCVFCAKAFALGVTWLGSDAADQGASIKRRT